MRKKRNKIFLQVLFILSLVISNYTYSYNSTDAVNYARQWCNAGDNAGYGYNVAYENWLGAGQNAHWIEVIMIA